MMVHLTPQIKEKSRRNVEDKTKTLDFKNILINSS